MVIDFPEFKCRRSDRWTTHERPVRYRFSRPVLEIKPSGNQTGPMAEVHRPFFFSPTMDRRRASLSPRRSLFPAGLAAGRSL